jgi:hypothetical protein
MTLHCRQPIQPRSLNKVLRRALALAVDAGEIELRASMTLRCRQPIQPRCLCDILRDAVAVLVAAARSN